MSAFTDFQNILPDPNNAISYAGDDDSASVGRATGPGFASVKFSSEQPLMRDRTNSGRLLTRAIAFHKWKISITYNPMTRDEFEPVHNFLLQRRGSLSPFFVSLPQYRVPQDPTFATYAASNNLTPTGALSAGVTQALITKSGYNSGTNKTPRPGDLFTITGSNSNHLKTYQITRVETDDDYLTSAAQPTASQIRVHFVPGLARAVTATDGFGFHNPLIKVIQTSNTREYSLNTDNLYQFSLSLEEVQ